MGCHQYVVVAQRLLQVEQQRQWSAGEQGKGEYQGETGYLFQLFDAEDVIKGGEDESSCHQTRHEGVHDDLYRPVDIFVGIDEEFLEGPDFTVYHHFTSIVMPR